MWLDSGPSLMARGRRRAALALAAGVAGLAGCGGTGQSSDQQAVRKLVDNYDAALTRGDYARACADSSMPLQQKVVSAAKRLKPSVSDCATALKTIITAGNINAGQLLSKTKLGAITVNGDRATIDVTASVSGRQVASQSQAVRENGQWRLAENTSSSSSKKTS